MERLHRIVRPVGIVVAACFLSVALPLPGAQAALIGTGEVVRGDRASADRAQVLHALDRREVREKLASLGVGPAQAKARVDALSDAEAHRLAARMDALPAGGNGLVGALVFVFLVLVFTDLLGLTDVFTFTKKGSLNK